jgi:hypothetical protein
MSAQQPSLDSDDRAYLARKMPAPADRELPGDRHQILRGYLMNEFDKAAETAPKQVAAPRRRQVRRLVLAGALAVSAGVAVAVGPSLFSQEATSPAWAVSTKDNKVTVRITEVRDAAGLEKRLQAEGVHAIVDYIPLGRGCDYPDSSGAKSDRFDKVFGADPTNRDGIVFTINRGELKAGQTVGIIAMATSDDVNAVAFGLDVLDGPGKHCVLNDNPSEFVTVEPAK